MAENDATRTVITFTELIDHWLAEESLIFQVHRAGGEWQVAYDFGGEIVRGSGSTLDEALQPLVDKLALDPPAAVPRPNQDAGND